MSGGPDALRRVRRVAEALAGSADPDARWLGEGLGGWIGGDELDRALGLARGGSGPSWRRHLRWAERDALVRELAGLYAGPPTAKAEQMSADMRHYAATGWLHDRSRGSPWPDTLRRRLMFAIHRADPGKAPPSGVVRLLEIMRGE